MPEVLKKIEDERERVRNGETSELMDLLISRKWQDLFGPFTKHPRDAGREMAQASPIKFYKKGERP